MTTEAETEWMRWQECQQLPEAGRGKGVPCSWSSEGNVDPANTLDFNLVQLILTSGHGEL